MPIATRKPTIRQLGIKYGGTPIPPDDPIFKPGFTVGATVPYRQRPADSTNGAASTAPAEPVGSGYERQRMGLAANARSRLPELAARRSSKQT